MNDVRPTGDGSDPSANPTPASSTDQGLRQVADDLTITPDREARLRRTAARLASGDGNLDASSFIALRSALIGYVRRFYSLSPSDLEDIADEVIANFLDASHSRRIDKEQAMSYLRTSTLNEARDRLRRLRTQRNSPTEVPILDEDQISRFLSKKASAEIVLRIQAIAAADEDWRMTRVVEVFLEQAELLGKAPSQRLVARASGLNHTSVRRCLERARAMIEDQGEEA